MYDNNMQSALAPASCALPSFRLSLFLARTRSTGVEANARVRTATPSQLQPFKGWRQAGHECVCVYVFLCVVVCAQTKTLARSLARTHARAHMNTHTRTHTQQNTCTRTGAERDGVRREEQARARAPCVPPPAHSTQPSRPGLQTKLN